MKRTRRTKKRRMRRSMEGEGRREERKKVDRRTKIRGMWEDKEEEEEERWENEEKGTLRG